MACDLQMTHSGGMKFKTKSKIIEVPTETCKQLFGCEKAFIGFCGSADVWPRVIDFFYANEAYEKPPKTKGIEMMMLNNKGIFHATNLKNWMLIDEPHLAIGSGSHFAVGAMSAGKSPREAVKVAMKHDPNTGMGIKEYTL